MLRWSLKAGAIVCALLWPDSMLAAQDFPARIRDDSGREVTIDEVPDRIISLVPVATEILFALAAGGRVVGRSRFDDYPPEALNVPDLGDAILPSIEGVLVSEPDLVILIGGADNATTAREMERLGVPFISVLFNSLEDLGRNILRLGRIVGRPLEAQRLWARVERDLRAVRAAVTGLPRPAVYYDVGYPPAFTAGAGSYLDTLISIAGGRNVFSDLAAPSPRVSLEAILGRDPDIILHPVGEHELASVPPPARPGWESLRAVRTDGVRRVDADLVHRLGPRVGEAAREIAVALHPTAFRSDPR